MAFVIGNANKMLLLLLFEIKALIDRIVGAWKLKLGKNINLLLTEREGRTGEYWPEVVAVRTERSEVRTKTTEGQYSPVPSRASEVSKWFIIWHHFSYETTLPVVHSSQFPARCQGKKPAILTGFRISLMIVAVDRQKLAWLLNENCSASIICVSFSSSCTTQESFI